MTGPLTAFIFLSTLSICHSTKDQISVTVAQPGDSVTIICSSSFDNVLFDKVYWYKQTPGRMIQYIAYVYYEQKDVADSFKDQRFYFTAVDKKHIFEIRNIRREDEAIYYCQIGAGSALNFNNGTFLVVEDGANSQSCVHVRQSPSSAAVAPGRSVSLQCSLQPKNNMDQIQCPQQHNMHWFRAGSEEPHTGLMYSVTNSSCVYRLSKTIGRSSDAGTYYCAVESCGHILFGTGTKVDMELPLDPVTVALSVLLSGCVLVIIVLCVKRVCAHCRDSPDHFSRPHSEMSEHVGSSAYAIYAALKQTGQDASVYSTVQYRYKNKMDYVD